MQYKQCGIYAQMVRVGTKSLSLWPSTGLAMPQLFAYMEMTKLKLLLKLILVCVCLNGPALAQEDDCILSRLDILPCKIHGKNKNPGDNEFGLYRTRIREGDSGLLECRYRNPKNIENEMIGDITTLGDNFRIVYSPGFLYQESYANQLLVFYNIKCPADWLAFFNVSSLKLREADCQGRCADYISVARGDFGVTESCGSTPDPAQSMFQLEQGEFTITFRTSKRNREEGFEIYVICFNPEERDQPGCTSFEGNTTSSNTTSSNRRKRDLEEFHNRWQRRLKRQARKVRFLEIAVPFGDNVTYSNNIITIISQDGSPSIRFRSIRVLQTFDVEGVIQHYVGKLVDDNGLSFLLRGPGPLVIIGQHAYLQLFAIDPRGLVPNEVEEAVLGNMTSSLLEQLDPVEDDINITRPELPTERISPALASLYTRRRRQVGTESFVTDGAICQAVRAENACNPVLRTTSRVTLVLAEQQDPERLAMIRRELDPEMMALSGDTVRCAV